MKKYIFRKALFYERMNSLGLKPSLTGWEIDVDGMEAKPLDESGDLYIQYVTPRGTKLTYEIGKTWCEEVDV